MKIKHFFGLAVLAAMTASCSSNNELVNGGNGSGENESGVSYASFSINLPTTSGTRADSGPTFEKGDANEYDVYNATLLVSKRVQLPVQKVIILLQRLLIWVLWNHGRRIQVKQV